MANARVSPHPSAEELMVAERQVLGALLQDNSLLWQIDLAGEDFLDRRNAELFETLAVKIREEVSGVDVISVAEDTGNRWTLQELGELHVEVMTLSGARNHARFVRAASRKRQQRAALHQAIASLDAGEEGWWDQCVTQIQRAEQRERRVHSHDDVVQVALEARKERARAKAEGREYGVRSTIPTLDAAIGGVYGGRLWICGGRPGSYKSALAWQISAEAARRGMPVAYISLEMDDEEIGDRTLRYFSDDAPSALPLYVDQDSRTIDQVTWSAMEFHARFGVKLVVVDHIQLVESPGSSRYDSLSTISRRLKALSMRLGIPVLALSQLSREVERDGRAPRLSDLRESGSLEQDADVVMFLWLRESKGKDEDRYFAILAKNRRGYARMKPVPLMPDGARMRIREAVE